MAVVFARLRHYVNIDKRLSSMYLSMWVRCLCIVSSRFVALIHYYMDDVGRSLGADGTGPATQRTEKQRKLTRGGRRLPIGRKGKGQQRRMTSGVRRLSIGRSGKG